MGTMFNKTSTKIKTEMARTGRRRFKEDESEKFDREVFSPPKKHLLVLFIIAI